MAGSLLSALFRNESGGRNIANTTQGTSSGQAQGYFQITTGTWNDFGGRKYAETPMQATYQQQAEIASKIPLKRWDESTINVMRATGKPIDPNRTLGENLSANGENINADFTATPGTSYTAQPGPLETTGSKGEEVWAQPETRVRHPQNPQVGTGGYIAPGSPSAPVTATDPIVTAAAVQNLTGMESNPWNSLASGLAASVKPGGTGLGQADTGQLAAPEMDITTAAAPVDMAPVEQPGGEMGQLADLFKLGDFGQAAALNVDRMGNPIIKRQYG